MKANFGLRLVAFLIDILILGVVGNILMGLFGGFGGYQGDMMGYKMGYYNGGNFLPSLLFLAYFVVMDVMYGATLGKKAMKLKVVNAKTGKLLNWQEAILREVVGRFVNGITLGIGYLWVLWDENKQGLHDKIGNTYVVKA